MSKAKYQIDVENGVDENGAPVLATCYLKEMDRGVLERVLSLMAPTKGDPQYIRAGELIINSCWLDDAVVEGEKVKSDKAIKTDDNLLVAAAMKAFELVDIRTASIKKL